MSQPELEIKGVLQTSMLDYPGQLSTVIFLGGCQFRCAFCHNPELVLSPEKLPNIGLEDFLAMIEARKKWVSAIVITGGEPTLHPGLPDLVKRLKAKGFKVKLDTNGGNPKMLKELLDQKLLDYVAMDIKTSPEEYERLTGCQGIVPLVEESMALIKVSGLDHEFRTTAVPGLFDEARARKMAEWVKGGKRYVLQQFNAENLMVDKALLHKKAFTPDQLKAFAPIFKPFVEKVEIRGI